MILLVFLNKHDKNSYLLGRSLPDYLKGDYVKVYTRYKDGTYEECEVRDTLSKIKEYAQVFGKVIISFGLRIFPTSAYKDIISKHSKANKSLVFLKELRGSKTWSINKDQLSFDNYRVTDTGLFILKSEDILASKSNNFNIFLKELVRDKKLSYKLVPYWLFTNRESKDKGRKRGGR